LPFSEGKSGNQADYEGTKVMLNAIYLEANKVPQHLRGGYSGKKFKAIVTTEVTIPSHAGIWDGGSRETYQLIHLETGKSVQASDNMSAPWNAARKDQHISLQPGFAVVAHSMFCGKDMGLTFYVHPDNAAKLLPAPSAELSEHEQIVLNATCEFKSHYNGQDRYSMAKTRHEYPWQHNQDKPFPTRGQWDVAKAELISKGLLNKSGAVTPAGRNACIRD
jgi:hypothetical protein